MAKQRKTQSDKTRQKGGVAGSQRAGLVPSPHDEQRYKKLLQLVRTLPETEIEAVGDHSSFAVAGKRIAWYLFDHHGDGLVSLCCKSTPSRQKVLLACDPKHYFLPAYVGSKGWIGLRLDLPTVNWGEVSALLIEAYRLQAPARLAKQIDCKAPWDGSDC
jgi:hypothetical protein